MADLEFLMKVGAKAVEERVENEECWWYLSFADEKGFNGAILVRVHGIVTARLKTAELGFNPGGEVLGLPVPEGGFLPAECYQNRLLSRAELERAFAEQGGVKSLRVYYEEERQRES